jgi:hypothetical protein
MSDRSPRRRPARGSRGVIVLPSPPLHRSVTSRSHSSRKRNLLCLIMGSEAAFCCNLANAVTQQPSHSLITDSNGPPPMDTLATHENFQLGPFIAPRVWTGLWQLSSNAWGTASASKIRSAMGRHVALGHTAFGGSHSTA